MPRFQKVKGTKIYEVVISQLKDQIASGLLRPGDMLPPEKTISEEMGVSRASVREALKVLEFMGFLESKPSEGTKIAQFHPDLLLEKLHTVSLSQSSSLLLDLIELREVLEPKIAATAATRGTEEELQDIARIVGFGQGLADEVSREEADAQFHLAIAKASHNVFFVRLVESVLSMLVEIRSRSLSRDRDRSAIAHEHSAIVESLLQRDAQAASTAMKKHLQHIRRSVNQKRDDIDNTDALPQKETRQQNRERI
ncbi:putative HTH-type transcriptional regulator LutR [uncultured delta proteobacterium]|uniref:Putative HTH-type transcriptional regulator LutR n=1 Tax=uncultured delta proteobacterium TaxID=34034 RepID=A0A212JCY9_9DELT|nr:putative HTH-type transcriptional regulator LutR [uncultured delta proteobacterium]